MSDPKDKLEDGVYVLKSAAWPWMAIQIGDIIDPVTKAREITVENIVENNKAQQWRSTYEANGNYGYGLYTLQSQGEGLTGYYLNTALGDQDDPVRGELSQGQNLNWWSGCKNGTSFLRIFLVGGITGISANIALSYLGNNEIGIESLPPPAPGAEGGNWGESLNLWTPVKVSKPKPKDILENGVYVLKSVATPWLAIQIGDIVDPATKARKITVEKIDENNKAQHWRSTYQDNGDYGYGLYTFQSQSEGLTSYYLSTTDGVQAEPVRGELSQGQNLNWWSGCKDGISDLRIFLVGGISVSNALSYEDFAGTEVRTVSLPLPPPGAEGGNWGATSNLWTPVRVEVGA